MNSSFGGNGGGFLMVNGYDTFTDTYGHKLSNLTFSGWDLYARADNTNTFRGGGVIYLKETMDNTVTNVLFKGNRVATRYQGHNVLPDNTYGGGGGGAIYIAKDANNTKFYSTTFQDNIAKAEGTDTKYAGGGAVYIVANTGTEFHNSVFTGNTADVNNADSGGGAAYLLSASVTFNGVTFGGVDATEGNTAISMSANVYGGALYAKNSTLTFQGDNNGFAGNTATTTAANGFSYGGAIYLEQAAATTTTLAKVSFTGNEAEGANAYGGAIYKTQGTLTLSGASATDQLFANNTADGVTTSRGGAVYSGGGVLNVSNIEFYNNSAEGGTAYGGAVYTASTITGTTATFNSAAFTGNKAEGAFAAGGAIYQVSGSTKTSDVMFYNNQATATNTATGGGVHITAGNYEATGSTFKENIADGDFAAYGGAVYSSAPSASTATFTNSIFTANYAQGGTETGGGAVYNTVSNMTFKSGVTGAKIESFIGNAATATEDAFGGAIASMGGKIIVEDQVFTSNSATATNSGGLDSYASGGAIVASGNTVLSLKNTDFFGNFAEGYTEASGGAVLVDANATTAAFIGTTFAKNHAQGYTTALAQGGAIANFSSTDTTELQLSTVSGNEATGGDARGGGIYSYSGNVRVVDTSFSGNRVTGTTAAYGSAIYAETANGNATTTEVELFANTRDIVIENNFANGYATDAIYFGTDGTQSSANANFKLAANTGRTIDMQNGFGVDMTGKNFTLNKTGAGTLRLGGTNYVDVHNNALTNSATINLAEGKTIIGGGSTTIFGGTGDASVKLEAAAELNFELSRNPDLAMFNFSNDGKRVIEAAPGATTSTSLDVTLGRVIRSIHGNYVIASGVTESMADAFIANVSFKDPSLHNVVYTGLDWYETDSTTGEGNLYAGVHHFSPYDYAGANPIAAQWAVEQLVQDTGVNLRDEEYLAIYYNPRGVTPGLILDQGRVMLNATDRIANNAVDYALRRPYRSIMRQGRSGAGNRYDSRGRLMECAPAYFGIRFWAGYVGDWDRVSNHGGYQGYSVSRHGFLAGVNYDFGESGSIGIYGGYTHGSTKGKGNTAKITQDAGHFGLLGRVTPIPGLSFYGDMGYHFGNNDARRHIGTYSASTSFDQDVFTAGIAAEYAFCFGNLNVTPRAELRYAYLDQDGVNESGLTATRMGGFSGHSLTQRIGADVSYDFNMGGTIITPSVNAAWRHDYGTKRFSATANYIGPANPIQFRVKSNKAKINSVDLGAGVRALINAGGSTAIGINLYYNVNLAGHNSTHSIYAGFDIGF